MGTTTGTAGAATRATAIEYLPFEAPLAEMERSLRELMGNPALRQQAELMQQHILETKRQFYDKLTPWQTVQIARHHRRPQTRDYLASAFDDAVELHGDRAFGDDKAIVTALATLGAHRVMLVGQHKGRNVDERYQGNAGCPHPEGYRKAMQKMRLAERFGLPVICLIDTKGAYPGIGAEERGQGIALAENIRDMSNLRTPVICVIIGEGGSGGALAIGVGDRILMLEHAYYSVISPEGCASILWRDGEKKAEAAEVLKLTSRDLKTHGFIDEIVAEPLGGAHHDPADMARRLRTALIQQLDVLRMMPLSDLLEQRYQKFRRMGVFVESANAEIQALAEAATAKTEPAGEGASEADPATEAALPSDDGSAATTSAEAGAESDDATAKDGGTDGATKRGAKRRRKTATLKAESRTEAEDPSTPEPTPEPAAKEEE